MTAGAGSAVGGRDTSGWAGHPRGLSTLFFTEMWERFSYYGMRGFLILYMVKALGFTDQHAGRVYGNYVGSVWLAAIFGGLVADRWLGQYRSVLVGGIIIALGHFTLAFHPLPFFYVGLSLIVVGTGLLKPNVSTIVGALYEQGDERRDAGFSIFYMGINVGALVGPIIAGRLAEGVDWHLGFACAGVGMTLGLIQYVAGRRRLQPAIERLAGQPRPAMRPQPLGALLRAVAPAVTRVVLRLRQWLKSFSAAELTRMAAVVVVAFFVFAPRFSPLRALLLALLLAVSHVQLWRWLKSFSAAELKRMAAVVVFFVFASLFWGAFEQAGSTLNLFADRYVRLEALGMKLYASWFVSIQAGFVILLSPAFAWLWVKLGPRQPSSPAKFTLALLFMGVAFLLLMPAGAIAQGGVKVTPLWLVGAYFIQELGEVCLYPVGLSVVTKLAPTRVVGLMMGVFFLSNALGNKLAGWSAGFISTTPLPTLFGVTAGVCLGAALVMFLLIKPVRNLMGGVH